MTLEKLKTAVWSYAIKRRRPPKEIEFYYDTVRDSVTAFAGASIMEFNELENQETVVEDAVPIKQRDLFDHNDSLDYAWERFVERLTDENS